MSLWLWVGATPDFPQSTAVMVTRLLGWVSLQFNWYTRRAVLAGIYNTTELVMMQDSSPDFEDTWRFLDNRINDAMNMGHTAKQVVGASPLGSHLFRHTTLLKPQLVSCPFAPLWPQRTVLRPCPGSRAGSSSYQPFPESHTWTTCGCVQSTGSS